LEGHFRNHHKGIANMVTDTLSVPATRLGYAQRFGGTVETITEYAKDTPIMTFLDSLFRQLVEWKIYMLTVIYVGEHWFALV
jgi:hypothetical protein